MVGVGNFAHNRGSEILVSSDKYTAPKSSLLNYGYRGGGHCNLSRFPKSATATHILHIDDDLQRALRGQPRVAFPPLICTWQWDKHLLPHSFHLWFHLEQRGNSEERRNESHDSEENFLPDLPLYQLLAKYFFSVFTTMLLAFKNKLSEVVEGAESPHWLVQLVCKHLSEQSCQGQVVPISTRVRARRSHTTMPLPWFRQPRLPAHCAGLNSLVLMIFSIFTTQVHLPKTWRDL